MYNIFSLSLVKSMTVWRGIHIQMTKYMYIYIYDSFSFDVVHNSSLVPDEWVLSEVSPTSASRWSPASRLDIRNPGRTFGIPKVVPEDNLEIEI